MFLLFIILKNEKKLNKIKEIKLEVNLVFEKIVF